MTRLRRIWNAILDVVRPIHLNITADDIAAATKYRDENGNRLGTSYCPANLAARRQFAPHAYVGRQRISLMDKTRPHTVRQLYGGSVLSAFTDHWDRQHRAEPVRIRLYRTIDITFPITQGATHG